MKTLTDYVCVFVPIIAIVILLIVSIATQNNVSRKLTTQNDNLNAIVNQIR